MLPEYICSGYNKCVWNKRDKLGDGEDRSPSAQRYFRLINIYTHIPIAFTSFLCERVQAFHGISLLSAYM